MSTNYLLEFVLIFAQALENRGAGFRLIFPPTRPVLLFFKDLTAFFIWHRCHKTNKQARSCAEYDATRGPSNRNKQLSLTWGRWQRPCERCGAGSVWGSPWRCVRLAQPSSPRPGTPRYRRRRQCNAPAHRQTGLRTAGRTGGRPTPWPGQGPWGERLNSKNISLFSIKVSTSYPGCFILWHLKATLEYLARFCPKVVQILTTATIKSTNFPVYNY